MSSQPGDTELDVGQALCGGGARPCGRCSRPTLDHALNLHLLEAAPHATRSARPSWRPGTTPGAQEITACFADLVGFTRLGEQLPPEELGQVSGRLGELAARSRPAPCAS